MAFSAYLCAQTRFYGEVEPHLFTATDLMTVAPFKPVSIEDAKQLGIAAQVADKLYAGEFTLPRNEKIRNTYKSIIVRSPNGTDVLYVDKNRDGRFQPNERLAFLPVVNPEFRQLKDLASFDVDLPPGGIFSTCPMQAALLKNGSGSAITAPELAVSYTSTAFVRGFAILPDRHLSVRFEYDFDLGGVSLKTGREWIDLNDDGKFDIAPGSPEALQANGSAPIFVVGHLTLQVESVNLRRDQFVIRAVPASPPRKHWHFPFQK